MIIDETNRIIFIHIPKSAGDSIRHLLCNHGNHGRLFLGKHANYRMAKNELGDQICQYKTFSVIRNPYDRILSFYHHLRKPLFLTTTDLESKYPSYTGRLLPEWACEIAMRRSFPDFIKIIYSAKHDEYPQRRWLSESRDWLIDLNGRVATDILIKYEDLHNEFSKFCCEFGIYGDLPWLGASESPKSSFGYRDWYDDESLNIVTSVFHSDLELFGYQF